MNSQLKHNYHENGIVHQALMMSRITASVPAFWACGLGLDAEALSSPPLGPLFCKMSKVI